MAELLAPAGSQEQLIAAVRCGADAVYFGPKNFNARRNADNFGGMELEDAVSYCHARNVKTYITLNTLIKDNEIPELVDTVRELSECGVDGVLVQDLAVYSVVKNCCPDMPIHASTQMAVHNVSGAKQLEEMGFRRIVLARELSLNEIREICSSVNCEIEVFVHGAHCMSASGLCYMSSALGTRSGNRGLCAQPCRLNFRKGSREYALSLKDMCLIDEIKALTKCGVASLKIEGRMKRPEYVAAAVTQYRNALKGFEYNTDDLKNVFSRSGFTKGYLDAKRNLDMFGTRTKDDVINMTSALPSLKNLYKDEISKIPVNFSLTVKENLPCSLSAGDGINNVTVPGIIPPAAVKLPLNKELAEKSLVKTGGTIFYSNNIETEIDTGLTLPASEINRLRREALNELYSRRAALTPFAFREYISKKNNFSYTKKKVICHFRSAEQIFEGSYDRIILPLEQISEYLIDEFGDRLIAQLPVLIYAADEKKIKNKLSVLKNSGLKSCLAENIGAIKLIKEAGLSVHGGKLLNVINSVSCNEYAHIGVNTITLSHEISFEDINKINSPIPFGFAVYGYLPLMHFRCCPMQGKNGCGDCDGRQKLTDRLGKEFTVLCSSKKYSVLHNCVPLYTGINNIPDADFYTLYFTTETKEECRNIYNAFVSGKNIDGPRTLGLYNKNLQ